MALTFCLWSVTLSQHISFYPITLPFAEFLLHRNIKSMSFIKSWDLGVQFLLGDCGLESPPKPEVVGSSPNLKYAVLAWEKGRDQGESKCLDWATDKPITGMEEPARGPNLWVGSWVFCSGYTHSIGLRNIQWQFSSRQLNMNLEVEGEIWLEMCI